MSARPVDLLLRLFCSLIGGFLGAVGGLCGAVITGMVVAFVGLEMPISGVLELTVPYLLIVMSVMGMIVGWILPARQRALKLCHGCKYDLTGNLSGRCPECGEPLTRAQRVFVRQRSIK